MLNNEQIQVLKNCSLHLDCPSIHLTSGDGTKQYAGPGYIRQQRDHGFRATLFVPGTLQGKELFEAFNAGLGRAGKLIPREERWSLTAVDTMGRTWRGSLILCGN